jgi:hypothetical protein
MASAPQARAPSFRVERYAHRCHKRASCENAAKIVVYCLHNRYRLIVFHASAMKKKLGQSGEQRGRRTVSHGVSDPK